ncbi:MAG: ATP-binding cassette domain-containing protein [Acidimicrobiales bacterium]|nr:ATP-binding cassette domain-containing protein [Acidimicrobiales bacterium]MCB9394972.1 ATP-binding cassette domain-containing protein [Acidimicrobiaceae bacterium]
MTERALEVEGLTVTFPGSRGLLSRRRPLRAVDDVSFAIDRGETLGLVGESGSGKSSTARGILGLVPVSSGSVRLDGAELTGLSGGDLRRHRRHIQMVFQDPYSSLDPSSPIGESIAEPMVVHERLGRGEAQSRVAELLDRVGLRAEHARRYPYEFSGGQRQRVAIARAIALRPKVVICDEAVSALDVSTQNQVINLLQDLRDEFGIGYLFVAHDLAVVRHISDRVAVMYLGRIVEHGPAERIFGAPRHPYTEALLSASPVPHPARQRERTRIVLPGDLPDPRNPPPGCTFASRCAHVMDVCRVEMPPVTQVDGGGEVRCHLHATPVSVGVPRASTPG